MALSTLKLADFADPELLAVINDVSDDDGWAETHNIAAQLGFEEHADGQRSVSARLTWMERWEWVERHPDRASKRWRVTAMGADLMSGRLNPDVQQMLDNMRPADRVRTVRRIGEQTVNSGSAARQMVRREWRRTVDFGMGRNHA